MKKEEILKNAIVGVVCDELDYEHGNFQFYKEEVLQAMDEYASDLQSENERLKAALEEIVDPIKAMKEKLKDGEKLNGLYAVDLSNNANYLKRIAENALSPQPPKQ